MLAGLLPGQAINLWFLGRIVPAPRIHFTVPATFTPLQYLRSKPIITWWLCRSCSFSCSCTLNFHICYRTNICSIAVRWHQILSKIHGLSIATQWILVWSQIWQHEVHERLKVHNVRTDHVMVQSELRYLIGAKIVNLKCLVSGGKTSPFPTALVFHVVRPVAMVRCRLEPDPEPTRQFGPVANTTHVTLYLSTVELTSGVLLSPWQPLPGSIFSLSLVRPPSFFPWCWRSTTSLIGLRS